ncbi:MAG: hypothetical protein IPG92_01200 [Flavobacteriales bacterium]|nr:hypothetical protein [Flavobacteriales bacterium]
MPDGTVRSLADFHDRFERILRNHIAYRGLLLSMARLLSQLPKVKAQYRATQEKRQADLRACFRTLVTAGDLRSLNSAEEDLPHFLLQPDLTRMDPGNVGRRARP